MTQTTADRAIGKFQETVSPIARLGVSEFARSKEWRKKLPEEGCIEVVDRSGVVGYMLAPEYAEAISGRITELEQQAERAQIAAMFDARKNRPRSDSGEDLRRKALAYFDENAEALEKAFNER